MDICHLKNAELEAKHQKYKGRVVLRGDIVKDNSGSYAEFTEQGSSASQMTAAEVMDTISRLPGCAGQAADAVSAYTQVKMEGCTQRQCEISKDIVDNYRTMFESRISAGEVEKLPFLQNLCILHGLMTWLVMQRSVWNDIVSWRTRRLSNSTKYLLHASMTTTSKKKQNLLENCQIHAFKLF